MLDAPSGPAQSWAGLRLDRPIVMGILNVTPDSFSDGGRYPDHRAATEAGHEMVRAGASVLDIGGESTRPGAPAVGPGEEQDRIIPVIRALAREGYRISVDTRNASTMAAALDEGACIVNDVSALAHDPGAAPLVAARGCPVVLMHMRGTPETMTSLAVYRDVAAEVAAELGARIDAALRSGIRPEAVAVDPGFGFAKTPAQSLALLRDLPRLRALGYPILVGLSRKAMIGKLSGVVRPDQRGAGSIAAALWAIAHGALIVRVHDVAETAQALAVWQAIETEWS